MQVDNENLDLKRRKKPKSFFEALLVYAFKKTRVGQLIFVYENDHEYQSFGDPSSPKVVIRVRDKRFFERVILYGDIGFGEAYILGYWTTSQIKDVLNWAIDNKDYLPTFAGGKLSGYFINLLGFINKIQHLLRPNSRKMVRKNISDHYDLSNDFFKLMLDRTMTYSSAIFKNGGEALDQAQINKYDRLCNTLRLESTDHLLEIGCGWGGFAVYAARKYKCKIDAITISVEQFNYVKELIETQELSEYINVELKDYRSIKGKYDKIVSIEMVEALGFRYLDTFFRKCAEALKSNGLMAIQCITFPDPHYRTYLKNTNFIQRYIFPGSDLLSTKEIIKSLDRTSDLMIWDIKSIGLDYAKTLTKWKKNFMSNLPEIRSLTFDDAFIRKWNFYLDYCIAGFESLYLNAVQILFSRPLNKTIIFDRDQ